VLSIPVGAFQNQIIRSGDDFRVPDYRLIFTAQIARKGYSGLLSILFNRNKGYSGPQNVTRVVKL